MAHLQYIDDLIKEYLLFRGFTTTLRYFENELKNDKDKGFRVDRITNQILSFIQTYDLNGLQDLWNHLDQRVFSKLSPSLLLYVKKFEISILRLYVVNTIHTNKQDKLHEFFDKMAPELQKNSEWRDWFVLPYLKGAEDSPTFAMYFTRQWQDTLFVSLQNFLAIVFQSMKLPTLATYLATSEKITSLQEENELLHVRLKALTADISQDKPIAHDNYVPMRIADDFYDIKDLSITEAQHKPLKGLFRRTGENSPPLLQNKPQLTSQPEVPHRRISSRVFTDDKRRPRSSSLAPASGSGRLNEHSSVKLTTGASESQVLRSPTKPHAASLELKDQDINTSLSLSSPFLLIARENYPDHRGIVSHTIFNQAGTMIASGDSDGVVKIWSPFPTPKTENSIVMKGTITSLEWLPKTEKFLMIASKSGTLKLYDTQEKRNVWDIGSESCSFLKDQRIMCVKGTPSESNIIISVAPKGKGFNLKASSPLVIIDSKTQKLENLIKLDGSIINTCVTNHNGGLLICGCNDGMIKIIDLRSLEVVASWAAHQGEVFTVKLSPQEDKIYSLGSDNKFATWSLAKTGNRVMEQMLHDKAAGPFLVGFGEGGILSDHPHHHGGRSVLLRPYGSLFALHQSNQYLFTCSPTGPIIYKMDDTSLNQVMCLKGHSSPVITIDWCSALQCGSCVSSSLDGKVTLTTLMPQ